MASDRPDSGASLSAPPNLVLAVERIAALAATDSVLIVGPQPLALASTLKTPARDAFDEAAVRASRDGVVLATGPVPWEQLGGTRIVLAADLGSDGTAIKSIRATRNAATDAGWHVAHCGLLHTAGRREGTLLVACRADDVLAETLDNGPLSLALDPHVQTPTREGRPARVLIASYEVAGPTGNGGIGTAYHSLAHVLAAAGHDVTLLFTGWLDPEQAQEQDAWQRRFADSGIDFSLLGTPWDVPVRNPHHQARRAYELHRWLAVAHATRSFDVVHVPECLGHAAYALTAKRLGLAYRDLEFVVGTHSSTRWVAESNRESIEDLDQLVTEQLERTSVELADVVLSPTAYLLDYMRDRDWSLPQRTFVQPLARPQSVRRLTVEEAGAADGVARRELVFFGRLETRKGLEAFCDAVDLLTADDSSPFDRVTLLGRPEQVLGEDATAYVERRAEAWGVGWEIMPGLGHDAAVAYLRERACVVAIPSLVDNSPNTVIEVVALGVPFVASRSGGTGELIAAEDLAASTFDGWHDARSLEPPTFSDVQEPFDARLLADALRAKAAAPGPAAAASVADDATDRVYDRWHRAIASRERSARPLPAGERLTATVCIVAQDGERAAQLGSVLARGTRAPDHVVAVVAGGRDAGPARRRIGEQLDDDVLIVLRGSEDPDPMLVERVMSAMRASDSDILSLVTRDTDPERATDTPEHLRRSAFPRDLCAFVPIPGPAIAAALYPALSVGPYAIRRSALTALGGYSSDTWGETVDRDLLARAALAGLRIDVLPEPLATVVEEDPWVELRTRYWGFAAVPASQGEDQIRIVRPFRRELEGPLADLPALLVGTQRSVGSMARAADAATDRRDELGEVYEGRIDEYNRLVQAYEDRLQEHRDLIALYERQKEELHAALNAPGRAVAGSPRPESPGRVLVLRVRGRVRRATRGPASSWPARGVRFARWRVTLVSRKLR